MSASQTKIRQCTGVSASWCPEHGDCRCPQLPGSEGPGDDFNCPLHNPSGDHPRKRRITTLQRPPREEGKQ